MKSVRLQLLVTLLATVVVAGVFATRGLPPGMGIGNMAYAGNVGAVRRSIRWGADVNGKGKGYGGWTPLHYAAYGGQKDVAKLLIAKGADVDSRDNDGSTALHNTAFTADNEQGKDVAELLIVKGADVNAKNNDGWTPLHRAVNNRNKDLAELLIAEGADVNARDNDGWTPLQNATANEYVEIAALLRRHGARELGAGERR